MYGGKGGQPCVIKPPCSGTWYMKQVDERNPMPPKSISRQKSDTCDRTEGVFWPSHAIG